MVAWETFSDDSYGKTQFGAPVMAQLMKALTLVQRTLFGYLNPHDDSEWRTVCTSNSMVSEVPFHLVQVYM